MSSIDVSISGLNEILESLDTTRIHKQLARDVGREMLKLHGVMRSSIYNRYTAQNDIQKQLISKTSLVKFGRHVITNSLQYKVKYSDLSKYPYTVEWGNINVGYTGPGLVHTVEVVRGTKFIVRGRRHRGGFTPRKGQRASSGYIGTPLRFRTHGAQMLEREGDDKRPTTLLFGPSTEQMIDWALSKDKATMSKVDSLVNDILPNIF